MITDPVLDTRSFVDFDDLDIAWDTLAKKKGLHPELSWVVVSELTEDAIDSIVYFRVVSNCRHAIKMEDN